MNRSIICEPCVNKYKRNKRDRANTTLKINEETGDIVGLYKSDGTTEYMLWRSGFSLHNQNCDLCNKEINVNESCYAGSIYKDQSEYYKWEDAYITKENIFMQELKEL